MKESIIFDLDGTLWDTSEEIEQVWKNVAQNYNIKVDADTIRKIMGYTKSEIIEYLFNGNSKEGNEFITKCQKKENEYLMKNGGHIYENTLETIKKLSLNYDLYIVSNCQSGYIETFLKYYDIEKYFKDYECSGNTGLSKEKNIKKVLERNNISKSVYVGDTIKDFESANKNGLLFIWAEYGFGKCDKFYKKINDICELINLEIIDKKYHPSGYEKLLMLEGTKYTLSSTDDYNEGIDSINSLNGYRESIKENGVYAIHLEYL